MPPAAGSVWALIAWLCCSRTPAPFATSFCFRTSSPRRSDASAQEDRAEELIAALPPQARGEMTLRHTALAAVAVAACMPPGSGLAQRAGPGGDTLKSVRMVRTDTPPVIDGRLDDAVWAAAAVGRRFSPIPAHRGRRTDRTHRNLPALRRRCAVHRRTLLGQRARADRRRHPAPPFASARRRRPHRDRAVALQQTGAAATSSKPTPTASSMKRFTRTSARTSPSGIRYGTWHPPRTPTAGPQRSRFR